MSILFYKHDLLKSPYRAYLKVADILANLLQIALLATSIAHIVGTIALVSSNEIRIVDTGQWFHIFEVWAQLLLQVPLEHLSTFNGICDTHAVDIPSANHQVVWINKGNNASERNMDFMALSIATNANGSGLFH